MRELDVRGLDGLEVEVLLVLEVEVALLPRRHAAQVTVPAALKIVNWKKNSLYLKKEGGGHFSSLPPIIKDDILLLEKIPNFNYFLQKIRDHSTVYI